MSNECPKCSEYAEEGKTFCGACGRSLKDIESGDNWTEWPTCGPDPKEVNPEKKQRGLLDLFFLAISLVIIFIVAFEAVVLVVNAPDVFGYLSDKSFGLYWMAPVLGTMFVLEGGALQAYWILIVIVIVACVVYGTYMFAKAIKPSGDATKSGGENTGFFWIGVTLTAYFIINLIFVLIWMFLDNDLTVPDFGDILGQMFIFANAGVWEEIASRLLYIGVPMAFISLAITGKKESLKCLLGGFGMSTAAVVLIIISGAIFGLAHYSGWDDQAWKVLATGIMGVFLGYLFVRFGLYAAILMHFIVDYFSAFDWAGVGVLGTFLNLLLTGIGFVALLYLAIKIAGSKGTIDSLPAFKNDYIKKDDNAP